MALTLPRQPAWIALSVGSIITASSGESGWRASSGVSALSPNGSSSRPKNSAPNGRPSRTSSIITASAPFMSLDAEPDDTVALAAAGPVALGRDGVEVPAEQHARALRAGQQAGVAEVARIGQQRRDMGRDRRLVA